MSDLFMRDVQIFAQSKTWRGNIFSTMAAVMERERMMMVAPQLNNLWQEKTAELMESMKWRYVERERENQNPFNVVLYGYLVFVEKLFSAS